MFGYKGNITYINIIKLSFLGLLVIKEMKYISYDSLCKLNRPHVIITLYMGVVEYYIHIHVHTCKGESKTQRLLQNSWWNISLNLFNVMYFVVFLKSLSSN